MPGKDLQNGQKHTSLSAHGRIVREHMFPDNIAMRPFQDTRQGGNRPL